MDSKELIRASEENFEKYYRLLTEFSQNSPDTITPENSAQLEELLRLLLGIEDEVVDFRLKKIVEEEHPYLPAISLPKIKRINHYHHYSLAHIIELFLRRRKAFIQTLYSLPAEDWKRTGVHEAEGHIAFKELIRRMIDKDRQLLEQLQHLFS